MAAKHDRLAEILSAAMMIPSMGDSDFDAARLWDRKIFENDMLQADWEELEMFLIEQEVI